MSAPRGRSFYVKRGGLIGFLVGAAIGLVLGGLRLLGWVVCASTGSSCGDSTRIALAGLAAMALAAILGAGVGASIGGAIAGAREERGDRPPQDS